MSRNRASRACGKGMSGRLTTTPRTGGSMRSHERYRPNFLFPHLATVDSRNGLPRRGVTVNAGHLDVWGRSKTTTTTPPDLHSTGSRETFASDAGRAFPIHGRAPRPSPAQAQRSGARDRRPTDAGRICSRERPRQRSLEASSPISTASQRPVKNAATNLQRVSPTGTDFRYPAASLRDCRHLNKTAVST